MRFSKNISVLFSWYFDILCGKEKHFSILARTSPLLSPPGVVVVDSRPPSNDSGAELCFKHETRYSWYDLRGKARHSDAFRASLVRAHFSLQSSNRSCLVKSYLGQIEVIYLRVLISPPSYFFIYSFVWLLILAVERYWISALQFFDLNS